MNALSPLVVGKGVVLKVHDSSLPHKRRVGDAPLLLINPTSVYGDHETGMLVVSLQGFGSEIIRPESVRPIDLKMVGLSMDLSKQLCNALHKLFTIN